MIVAPKIVVPDQVEVSCYMLTGDPIPLTGTIDAQGNISVTSAAVRGQVLSFTGVLAADRLSISQGAYTFKGGCADGHSGTLTGVKFKPIDGIYNGALAETGDSEVLSADLKQSAASDGNGFLDVTGTVTYSGACNEKFTVTSSDLAGRFIQLQLGAADGSNTTVYGNVDPDASKLWLADYEGGCNDFGGVGAPKSPMTLGQDGHQGKKLNRRGRNCRPMREDCAIGTSPARNLDNAAGSGPFAEKGGSMNQGPSPKLRRLLRCWL